MDDPPGGGLTPAGSPPAGVDLDPVGRSSGLELDTCYRHPERFTGVHCARCGRAICTDCMRPAAVGYGCPECLASDQKSGYQYQRGVRTRTGMPAVTRGIILVTIAVFAVEIATGASRSLWFGGDPLKLYKLGASFPPAIAGIAHVASGGQIVFGHLFPQVWRLVTPVFLHWGFAHIAMNMYGVAILGPTIEHAYGPRRFLALYLATGIMGNVAAYAFGAPNGLGVGASTAVFGLLGVWAAYNYRRRAQVYNRAALQSIVSILVLNLILNVSFSGFLDWRGHLGGLLSGAVLGYTAEGVGRGSVQRWSKVGGFVLVLVIGAVLVLWRSSVLRSTALGLFGG